MYAAILRRVALFSFRKIQLTKGFIFLYTIYKNYKVIIIIFINESGGHDGDARTSIKRSASYVERNRVRITPQRHAILEYLIQSMSHPTADEIYKLWKESSQI